MRTAVDKVGRGQGTQRQCSFSAMTGHYLFEAEFCNPASGWRRDRSRRTSRMRGTASWQTMPPFESLGALNGWLEERCRELWGQTRHGGEPGMIADVWATKSRASCVWTGYSMGS